MNSINLSNFEGVNRLHITDHFGYEQTLIGIVSTTKPYHLIWHINKELGFEFEYEKEWEVIGKDQVSKAFPCYSFINLNTETEHRIIKNQIVGAYLLPERKETDYFWVVNKRLNKEDEAYIVKTLTTIQVITTAYSMDIKSVKSKQNLVF